MNLLSLSAPNPPPTADHPVLSEFDLFELNFFNSTPSWISAADAPLSRMEPPIDTENSPSSIRDIHPTNQTFEEPCIPPPPPLNPLPFRPPPPLATTPSSAAPSSAPIPPPPIFDDIYPPPLPPYNNFFKPQPGTLPPVEDLIDPPSDLAGPVSPVSPPYLISPPIDLRPGGNPHLFTPMAPTPQTVHHSPPSTSSNSTGSTHPTAPHTPLHTSPPPVPHSTTVPQQQVMIQAGVPVTSSVSEAATAAAMAAAAAVSASVSSLHPLPPVKPPKQKRRYTTPKSSRYCHLCARHERSVSMVACGNVELGLCQKSVCYKCIQLYSLRVGGSGWACPHCRGSCPQRAKCFAYDRQTARRREKTLRAKMSLMGGVSKSRETQASKRRGTSQGNAAVGHHIPVPTNASVTVGVSVAKTSEDN